MSWDWAIWLSGIIFGLVIIMTIMNLAWGDEIDREDAKTLTGQLIGGLALAAGAVLAMTFVVKPVLAWIGTLLSKVF